MIEREHDILATRILATRCGHNFPPTECPHDFCGYREALATVERLICGYSEAIAIVERLTGKLVVAREIADHYQRLNVELADRIAAQSALLSRAAEKR